MHNCVIRNFCRLDRFNITIHFCQTNNLCCGSFTAPEVAISAQLMCTVMLPIGILFSRVEVKLMLLSGCDEVFLLTSINRNTPVKCYSLYSRFYLIEMSPNVIRVPQMH